MVANLRKSPEGFGFLLVVKKKEKTPEQFHAPRTKNPATLYRFNFGVAHKELLPESVIHNRTELEKLMAQRAQQLGLPEGRYMLRRMVGGPGPKGHFKRKIDLQRRGGSCLLGEIWV